MVEIGFLLDAGAVAFTDCDHVVDRHQGAQPLHDLCRSRWARWSSRIRRSRACRPGAAATSGKFASLSGLPAVSPMAERMGLDRDLALVEMTGARYHADQITTAARPARAGARQGERAGRDGGRLDPPPDAERTRRRRLPHLLQGQAAAALRGRPAGDGRGGGIGADRHDLVRCTRRRTRNANACRSKRPPRGAVALETLLPAALRLCPCRRN